MKKYYVVNEEQIVFGPASKEEAEFEADSMRETAINEKLEEWGCDPDDCSEERRMEAAWAIGCDGDLFEVISEEKCGEYLDDED